MSDIITKAQRTAEIIRDPSLPARRKIYSAMNALSGLTLSNLSIAAKEGIEQELAPINRIIDAHDIQAAADYEGLSDADALDIAGRLDRATRLCISSEADRVMQELDTAYRTLPVAAIEEVRQHPDIFVPLLIESLEQGICRARKGNKREGDASFFAAFLLAEQEVAEFVPLIMEVLRLPRQASDDLLGEGLERLTAPMFARLLKDETGEIDAVVADRNLDVFIRWLVAVTYQYLVRDESISRQTAIDALHEHFRRCVETQDYAMLAPLATMLGELAGETAMGTIRSAFHNELVDEDFVDLATIESQVEAGEGTVEQTFEFFRPTGMPDVVAELSRWACFRETPARRAENLLPRSRPIPPLHPPLDRGGLATGATTVSGRPKVGRNDPCPCGSGKKLKKCCRKVSFR